MELVSLVCLFVVAWSGTTSADGPTAVTAKEDGEAVLTCSFGNNAQGKVFNWWKAGSEKEEVFMFRPPAQIEEGRLFQGRVSHFPEALQSGNASIVIRPAKASDSGTYTCYFPNDPPQTRSVISLTVGAAAKPSVRRLGHTENGALLQCEVFGAFPKPHVEWQDSAGTVLQAEQPQVKLQQSGKYDIILNVIVTKSDNFSCIVTQSELNHQTRDQTFAQLIGAVMPHIETVEQTSEWALLQCEVRGVSPKTKLQWKDSFQNVVPAKEPEVIERGGSYDIILQTTVTKSDYYHCVATQDENGLPTEKKIYVNIGGLSYGAVGGLVGGVAAGILMVVGIILYVLYSKDVIQIKGKKGESDKEPHSVTPQGSVSRDVTSSDATAGLLQPSSAPV